MPQLASHWLRLAGPRRGTLHRRRGRRALRPQPALPPGTFRGAGSAALHRPRCRPRARRRHGVPGSHRRPLRRSDRQPGYARSGRFAGGTRRPRRTLRGGALRRRTVRRAGQPVHQRRRSGAGAGDRGGSPHRRRRLPAAGLARGPGAAGGRRRRPDRARRRVPARRRPESAAT